MATWRETLSAHLPPAQRDRIAAEEAREAREWESKQVDRQNRAEVAARMSANYAAAFEYQHGCTQAQWRESMARLATAREQRDGAAEYGSAKRAEVIVTGAGGQLVRMNPCEEASGRVMRADDIEAQLARARQQPGREFMQRMVADFDRRRGGKGVISRSQAPGEVRCLECLAGGIDDPALSFQLHNDPDFGEALPETLVPDHPPARSRRSGTGRKVPMIYR